MPLIVLKTEVKSQSRCSKLASLATPDSSAAVLTRTGASRTTYARVQYTAISQRARLIGILASRWCCLPVEERTLIAWRAVTAKVAHDLDETIRICKRDPFSASKEHESCCLHVRSTSLH